MSEEDLRSDMPPAEGPTLGEALQQQRPAAVPPKYNYNPTNLTNDERNEFKNYLIDKLGQPTSIQITEDKDGYRFTFKDGLVIETSAKGKSLSYPKMTQEIVDLAGIDPGYDIKFLAGLNKLAEERFKKQPIGKRSEGDNIDVKSAMSDRALKDPSTNRSQIEVTPAGSPIVNAPDTLDGNIIPMSRELLVQAQAGTEVEFEIIENDFYKENFPNGSVADIPVYFKIGGQIVGKLQRSESQDRAEIVRKLQAGETVTTKIASVISPNFNNARTADGQKYFYDPREAFGQTPTIVGTVVTDGILEFDAPTGDLTMRTPRGVTPGQVGFLIPADQNPEATDNVSMGSTADLTREAVTAVGEALKQKDFAKAQEIVASSDESRRGAGYARGDYLEFGQFGDGRNYMVYRSPSEKRLVRLDETNLEKALNNKPFKLGFVDVDQNGDYKSVSAQEADYTRIKDTFKKDFADFLADKKYNVNTQLANTPGQYTSPVTGQVYPSYQDYLFSPTERAGTARIEGQGYNSILTTDVVRTSMGFFHNPVISFSKGDILGKTTEDIAEKTTFESTKPGPSIDDMLNQLPNMFANDKASQNLTKDC